MKILNVVFGVTISCSVVRGCTNFTGNIKARNHLAYVGMDRNAEDGSWGKRNVKDWSELHEKRFRDGLLFIKKAIS